MCETYSDTSAALVTVIFIFCRALNFIDMSESDIDFSPALATALLFFLFRMLNIVNMYETYIGTGSALVTVILILF